MKIQLRVVAAAAAASMVLIGTPALALRDHGPKVQTEQIIGVHHPDCPGLVKDIAPGAPTPIAGEVWVKAGENHYSVGFQEAGYVAGPQEGHAVSHVDVCPPTVTVPPTQPPTVPPTLTPTTFPTGGQFSVPPGPTTLPGQTTTTTLGGFPTPTTRVTAPTSPAPVVMELPSTL